MKKIIAFFLCVVICIGAAPAPAEAAGTRDTSFEESLAQDLKSLGLFQGVSDTDFDLSRAPSRTEALIMLIRVLGKEREALNGSWAHPFVDVAPWASKYVGYAYQNGLTNGISATEFGTGAASAGMYLTFVLRALGYSDAGNADFNWNSPFAFATNVGILPDLVNTGAFWRADVVLVSYAALSVRLKGLSQTLAQKLISAGVFSQEEYDACYDADAIVNYSGGTSGAALSAEEIYSMCSPAVFYIEVYDASGTPTGSGSGFFIDGKGTAVTNFHVVYGCASAKITLSDTGKVYNVLGVYDYSSEEDWAVMKIDGSGFSYLHIGAPSSATGGATVYAIGSPLGLQNTISQGLVSNPSRTVDGVTYIQTSAAISHGSSGGALINKYGEVIGITSLIATSGQNLNLALPVSYIAQASLTAYAPLGNLRVENPYEYLKKFLMDYGTYYKSDGRYPPSVYVISMSSGNDIYSIYYSSQSDYICFSDVYQFDYKGMIYVPKSTSDTVFSFVFKDTYAGVTAGGTLPAATFCWDTPLIFTDYYNGYEEYQIGYEDFAQPLMVGALDFAQYVFDYYDLYISIKDFGFIAEYNDYMSS